MTALFIHIYSIFLKIFFSEEILYIKKGKFTNTEFQGMNVLAIQKIQSTAVQIMWKA
jgi:hypothetical protein